MPRIYTEQIFLALFSLAQTLVGRDWAGNPIPLQYSSRNIVPLSETPAGLTAALYQWDPRPERDVRTGLGRSRRMLHAQIDVRIQRNQTNNYPDTVQTVSGNVIGPFSTLLNNWTDNLYNLFSPADGNPQTLTAQQNGGTLANALPYGAITDCYPVEMKVDRGDGPGRVAVIYSLIEIITGG